VPFGLKMFPSSIHLTAQKVWKHKFPCL